MRPNDRKLVARHLLNARTHVVKAIRELSRCRGRSATPDDLELKLDAARRRLTLMAARLITPERMR